MHTRIPNSKHTFFIYTYDELMSYLSQAKQFDFGWRWFIPLCVLHHKQKETVFVWVVCLIKWLQIQFDFVVMRFDMYFDC